MFLLEETPIIPSPVRNLGVWLDSNLSVYACQQTLVRLVHNLSSSEIKKIQRVENMAARLIYCRQNFCHIRPLNFTGFPWPIVFSVRFWLLPTKCLTEWYLHTWSVPETMPAKVYDPLVPIVFKLPVLSLRRHSLIDHSLYLRCCYGTLSHPFAMKRANRLNILKSQLKTHLFN